MLFFVLFYTQCLGVIWIALFWAKRSNVPSLSSWLRASAKGWGILLFILFAATGLASETCQSNGTDGFSDCTVLSNNLANLSLTTSIFAFFAAATFTLITFAIGAIIEYRALD